jgi:hypothetical protein
MKWKIHYSLHNTSIVNPFQFSNSLHSKLQATDLPSLRSSAILHNKLQFCQDVSTSPNPQAEGPLFFAGRDCLLIRFTATLHIWRTFLPLRMCYVNVIRDPLYVHISNICSTTRRPTMKRHNYPVLILYNNYLIKMSKIQLHVLL